MTVDHVYKTILYAVDKNLQNGYVSPDDFNSVLMPLAQNSYLDYLTGEYQKYQVGRPISVVEIGEKEKIRQSISPLIYNIILRPFSYGIAPFPNDYEMVDAMWSLYGFYNIRFVNQPRLSSFFNSNIDPVVSNPVYLIQDAAFQFYPENIGAARMSYIRKPPSIVWAYVLDSNGVEVYDPFHSQQPVWGDYDMLNIIARALQLVGVNLQLNTVIGYSQEIKNGGQ